MKLQQVHLRINDAATGQPTPVRLRITDAAGNYCAPYGRLTEFATGVNQDVGGNVLIGSKKWCYIDGACEILLPPGKLHVEVTKGPEYKPIDEAITLLAGKMSLRLTIEPWCDMRTQGWYSGDTRAHYLSPDAALLEGRAEDLAVVNLLACEHQISDENGRARTAIPNILSFSGQACARNAANCEVAVNTLNRADGLGSLGLLNCHRVVYPLTSDDPSSWTLADWCDQCHRKKGLVIWAEHGLVDWGEYGCPITGFCKYGEALADLVLDKIDALEFTPHVASPQGNMADYYELLNAGLPVPIVGASGKECNKTALGDMRTYAFMTPNAESTYATWIEAVRVGRTFITNGPLLHLTVNGEPPAATLDLAEGPTSLAIRAEAKSWAEFDRLEILWNGDIVESAAPNGSSHQVELECDLPVSASGWLAARCVTDRTRGTDPLPFAHTSAVAVRVANSPAWVTIQSARQMLNGIDRMLQWARRAQSKRLGAVLEEARTILAKKLS